MSETPIIGIVSGGDEIRLRSYINHAIYAREHGLDYRVETGIDPHIVTKFDYKVSIIRRLLPHYEWLVWMDDDAFFTDFDATNITELVTAAEQDGQDLVIAEGPLEPNGFWSRVNTGVMIIRNSEVGRALVEATAAADLAKVRAWWDDERDGLFTNGDQDQMWWAIQTGGHGTRVRIVGHRELNSRGHYYENSLSDAFVMHFTGYPDKELGVARFADRFGIGQELVPEDLLDKYHVRTRSPLTGATRRRRELAVDMVGAVKYRLRPHKEKVTAAVDLLPAGLRRRLPLAS
ncbi:hypothetical protein MHY29_07430 [Micrococcus sp. ACRRV]|uniref:hypothetical protein n=1 Tax=Micrococcus sp. ACRRV TaxID=2918203 RepID=UPI001EF2FC8E|nr:hypothetical protein [Micrococcus sp. ACRRV]MCG7422653.1 hypothetical protein [Micrococcus sp. ACRRV]